MIHKRIKIIYYIIKLKILLCGKHCKENLKGCHRLDKLFAKYKYDRGPDPKCKTNHL